MSNRRFKRKTKATAKSPVENPSHFEEGEEAKTKRSVLQWSLLSLKVISGLTLLVVAVISLAYGVHHYARTTPRFAISQIEILGTKRLVREDVLRAAGLSRGQNLFALEVEETEKRLLESPWVSAVRVTRRLPDSVVLEVSEREAVALCVLSGKTFLVSQKGIPFKELGRGDPHDLPIVTGLSPKALAQDRQAELNRLSEALSLLREYERLGLSRDLSAQEVHLDPTGGVVLNVGKKGTSLVLGQGPFKRKLLRAERVLRKSQRAGASPEVLYLDNVAHPERVVLRVGL
jgi:cell division protein FtsQ